MALRTFRHNPSLGGFGGEFSSLPFLEEDDENAAVGANALTQIVKEIVDNAVDACRGESNNHNSNYKDNNTRSTTSNAKNNRNNNSSPPGQSSFRIRINLDPVTEKDGTQVMRVTVTDNGCGMEDIQKCVDAFQTSKGHNAENLGANQPQQRQQQVAKTSGRYGIGLTRKN